MPHHLEVAALGPLGARGGARDLVLDAALAARGKKQTRVTSASARPRGSQWKARQRWQTRDVKA